MEYEIYIDLFWLHDFCLEVLSLYLAAYMGRRQIRWGRLLAAAALGAFADCLFLLFPIFPRPAKLAVSLLGVGSLMNLAAFPGMAGDILRISGRETTGEIPGGGLRLLYADAVLAAASALLGGLLLWLRESFHLRMAESLFFLAGLSVLSGVLFGELTRERPRGRRRYPVRLFFRGRSREFTALVDSGNRLRTPGTGAPVSIISGRDCAGFLDEALAGAFGLLYIPYRAVGTERGLLRGVLLDKMEIMRETGTLTVRKPVVAIAAEGLSADGDFSMLLPEELLEEDGENRIDTNDTPPRRFHAGRRE